MSESELMNVGILVTSILGYAFVTAGIGALITNADGDSTFPVAWMIGGLMYGITVCVMWQG